MLQPELFYMDFYGAIYVYTLTVMQKKRFWISISTPKIKEKMSNYKCQHVQKKRDDKYNIYYAISWIR